MNMRIKTREEITIPRLSRTLRASVHNGFGDDECWPWQGYVDKTGYGRTYEGRRLVRAHRLVWRLMVGELRPDDVLDHMCHDPAECTAASDCPHRACVNPRHLQVTDLATNGMRSNSPTALNARKSRCKNGHPFSAANTITRRGGGRTCRACAIERSRAARAAAGSKPRLARRTVTSDELKKEAS